jgi:hypothetical protein
MNAPKPISASTSARKADASWQGIGMGRRCSSRNCTAFPNGGVEIAGTLRWDVLRLWAEVQNGLASRRAAFPRRHRLDWRGYVGRRLRAALEDRTNARLPFTVSRCADARTARGSVRRRSRAQKSSRKAARKFMEINTLFQLLALQRDHPKSSTQADLFPDDPGLHQLVL